VFSIEVFMRILLFICLLLVSAIQAEEAHLSVGMENPGFEEKPNWFKESFLDIREDVEEATLEKKRVLLYFYQDGCPYCAKLLKDNFGDLGIQKSVRAGFDVIAINMWGDKEVLNMKGDTVTEKLFASQLRVQFTPTLLFFNEKGQVVTRINGYFPPHKFKVAVDYVAQHQELKQSFAEFYAKQNPVEASKKIHSDKSFIQKPLRLADYQKTSPRPMVVFFEQPSCLACDELHNDILRREAVMTALTNLDAVIVNSQSDEIIQTPSGHMISIKAWAKKLNIQYAPSLVFFDTNGAEVFRTEAYLKTFHIHGALDYVVSGGYQYELNFQRYLQQRTVRLHDAGFEVDLLQ